METVPNEYVILISSKILGNSKFKLVQESDVADFFLIKENKCHSLCIARNLVFITNFCHNLYVDPVAQIEICIVCTEKLICT